MKKHYVLLSILFPIVSFTLQAQTPKWTTYDNDNTNGSIPLVKTLATDAAGNIWIGSYRSLVKYDQGTNWTVYNSSNSIMPNDNDVLDVTIGVDGTIWACTYSSGLYSFNGSSSWQQYLPHNSGIVNNYTYCVATDNPGNVYVGIYCGNYTNAGMVKRSSANNWSSFIFSDGYNYKNVESIAVDKAGNVWCGTNIGAYKYDGTTWTTFTKENTSSGLCGNYVKTIAVDPSGNIWFGCMDKDPVTGYWIGGGLSKFNGSTWTNYKPSNSDLKTGYISSIAFRNNEVWVGTGFCGQVSDNKGLYKFDGTNWTNYQSASTYPGTCVNDLVVDKNNNLWIAGSNILTKLDFNPTDVKEAENIPTSFLLNQNYPNPFNPETVISYEIPAGSYVSLKIYDLLGREVTTLVDEFQNAGKHSSQFSILNSQLSSGTYFYKLQAGNYTDVKKMMIVK